MSFWKKCANPLSLLRKLTFDLTWFASCRKVASCGKKCHLVANFPVLVVIELELIRQTPCILVTPLSRWMLKVG